METIFGKRGRFDIIYAILTVCIKPTKKTRILYRCNLSFNQLKKYLNLLLSLELLDTFRLEEKNHYRITSQGEEFLKEYKRIDNLLDEKSKNYI